MSGPNDEIGENEYMKMHIIQVGTEAKQIYRKSRNTRILSLIVAFLVILFTQQARTVKGEEKQVHNYDSSILCVIDQLECTFNPFSISDSVYSSYEIIKNSGLICIQTWPDETGTIELYKGSYGGYLAILRREDRVYCAQYINDLSYKDLFLESTGHSTPYYYELVGMGSGMYGRYRHAYFIDGTDEVLIYDTPYATEPIRIFTDWNGCLVPLMDE